MSQPASTATMVDRGRVEFIAPILGFENETEFELACLEPNGLVWSLESIRSPELRFIAVPPAAFFPGYDPDIDEAAVAGLNTPGEDLTMLVILTVSGSIHDATANLLAPVVISPGRGQAVQIVLDDDTLPLRAPLSVGSIA